MLNSSINKETIAKNIAFSKFSRILPDLQKHPKCLNFGAKETIESHWNKLPELSKQFWLERA